MSDAPGTDSPQTTPPLRSWLVLATFALLGLFLYSPSLRTPYIFDDDRTVSMNPNIMHLWPADWLWKETRPIGSLTFALNYQLHALDVQGFHLTNTGIHVASAFVLYLLLSLVLKLPGKDALSETQAQWMALAVAGLWLVHPLNTQAISYIAQRYESQMGLFFLTTLYCLARGSQAVGRHKLAWYLGAVAAGWLGMGTKEVMCTILAVAPLFDRAFLADSWKTVLRQRGWVYAAIVPSFVVLLLAQRASFVPGGGAASAGFSMHGVSAWEYFRTQPEVILHYIGIAIFPRQLIFDYAWPVQNDLLRAGIAGLIVAALFLGSVVLYIKRPRWGFAALSFFLILGPTSSFMPIADLAVEHRMYLSLISICAAAVFWGYAWVTRLISAEKSRQRFAYGLAIVALGLLSLRTYVRNEDYRQPIVLYLQNVRFNPLNRRAHNNLATELKAHGLLAEARQEYQIAAKLAPTHPHAWYQLGIIDAEQQKFADALKNFELAWKYDPSDSSAAYCIGLAQMELGNDAAALAAFGDALRVNPDNDVAKREIAWLLATSADDQLRDGKRSLKLAEEIYATRSDDPRLLEVMAAAYAEQGDFDQALQFAEQAMQQAQLVGWSESKQAALAAEITDYTAQRPTRRNAKAS